MGTWGVGNFDNDTACDWAYELETCRDLSIIDEAINSVLASPDLDADISCQALAAIETLARLKNNFGGKNSYTENVDNWVAENKLIVPDEMIERAKKALSLIASEPSELLELWTEAELLDDWIAELKDLELRL